MDTLVVCSGGFDSVTLSHKIAAETPSSISFPSITDSATIKELEFARCARRFGIAHDVIDINDVGRRLTG